MAWAAFPEAVLSRVLLAAVSAPTDVIALQSIERRARTLAPASAWARAAAHAQLGFGVCAALRASCCRGAAAAGAAAAEPDWQLALKRAAAGCLRCSPAPELSWEEAARSGHATAVLLGTVLLVFGGARRHRPEQEHAAAVAETLALDLARALWLQVNECGTSEPAPRVRPTLTEQGAGGALLVGGQTFDGPGTGYPFGDVWRLECERLGAGVLGCRWEEVRASGCSFPPRSCATAVQVPCGLLVIGGAGIAGSVLPCEAYCLADGAWRLPSQSGLFPPQGALHHGCYRRGSVVLVGGIDEAGLQRRGLGRPTDVHVLSLATWVWDRLARSTLTPPLHARAASVVLGGHLLIVGGDVGTPAGQSDFVTVLNVDESLATMASGTRQAVWKTGKAAGAPFAAAGHSVVGAVLLGGLGRADGQAPAAFLLPDLEPAAGEGGAAAEAARVPRWFPGKAKQGAQVPRWFKR